MPAPQDNSPRPADSSRRNFLKTSGAVVAGAALASQAKQAGAYEAFDDREIKIGLIGCGGRGTGAIRDLFHGTGKIRLMAMADAFDYRLEDSHRLLTKFVADESEKAGGSYEKKVDVPESRQFVGLDAYKKVLESDCDLVVMATPPGFRPPQFEAAIDAGKHVFMEKPVAVDAPGIRKRAGRRREG